MHAISFSHITIMPIPIPDPNSESCALLLFKTHLVTDSVQYCRGPDQWPIFMFNDYCCSHFYTLIVCNPGTSTGSWCCAPVCVSSGVSGMQQFYTSVWAWKKLIFF